MTNAVRHGGGDGQVELSVTPKPEFLCVQVDATTAPASFRAPARWPRSRTGGFGLFIVERLTRRWGLTREGQRTRVWFEFDYTPS